MAELIYRDTVSEVWVGNCLEPADVAAVMGERQADLLCVDAPYSEKTHAGHAGGKLTADRAAAFGKGNQTHVGRYASRKAATANVGRRDLDYAAWSPDDVGAFCSLWLPSVAGWSVSITDSQLASAWAASFEADRRYAFAPLPLVETGSRVRMTGDGPSNWTCWIVVARPRRKPFSKWGTLPGAYLQPGEREQNSRKGTDRIVGGKPLKSMCAIVGDYSRRGGLVVDPACGAGTALIAAKMCGRRSIGMELDRGRAELAAKRLRKAREQGSLFETPRRSASPLKQIPLFEVAG